ncbi:cystatin-9-like [Tupaia chinensis]|uniref:Cystatin-9 n=1 Tax=Tupaia chinensis TaxID=246437 RepID=L8YF10_TUPCH|nr:cystatin-9-like [Tupaia chinensis]ELV12976.1 Cystatin-9 [Tupaia chinensis]
MSHLPGTWGLPWVLLLLLVGFQLPRTHAWCSEEDMGMYQMQDPDFPGTVQFALHTFNQQSEDNRAYGLERVLSSWREQVEPKKTFSMKLQLRRTICRKSEGDIENCPFEENPGWNNTFLCFFTVRAIAQTTQLELLSKTCWEERP